MRRLRQVGKIVGVLAVLVVAGVALWLYLAPPALLRVGAGYSAKIVCSNLFIAGRDAEDVLAVDVQAPGHPLLRLMEVDGTERRVRALLLGLFAANEAVYRDGLGCAVAPEGEVSDLSLLNPAAALSDAPTPWPAGEQVELDPAIARLLSDSALTGPGMRAVVVVRNGKVAGEVYGQGFSPETPLLGWSMTKTVNAAIVGTLIWQGRLSLSDRALLPQWRGDERGEITLAQLLAMEDGLASNENYGAVTDVTRMLYLEPDMAAFAADAPLVAEPGTRFNYSSGSAVLISRIWMDRAGTPSVALAYPREALFDPLGMESAVMEADAAGTFVGSSYMYATARDWARFALFLLQDGVWRGERLLPEGFVEQMSVPNATSEGRYSRMQTWLAGRDAAGLPGDTFFLQGHDGQTIAVMPSRNIAVVRLGLTPRRDGYDVLRLVREVVRLGE
ncbi:putative hydrolase [Pseudorhizobium banfieldiae]|uniref:Putative hydrolase n=1 Tax=Pseudorhizobium banfieldiae TaxID=1125847 RepID=L0NGD4_9HYPH|nr:serine hydrolase [Pseudorhizobium banfieldiae]CAD6612908.1 6-aminohexanoate hydrolase [arsenite-oxidising bacterium NT-25]CCF19891.1 putative hydrolase [Pseudorhizobium banfieldiae]